MKIVCLNNGMGNQLFQICFALHLRSRGFEKVLVDISHLISYRNRALLRRLEVDPAVFGLRVTHLGKLLWRTPGFVRSRYLHSFEDPSDWNVDSVDRRRLFVQGYFQDKALVDLVADEMLPPLVEFIGSPPVEGPFVAAHVRLGDYLQPVVRTSHGVVDPTWSLERCLELSESQGVRRRIIFTDSPKDLNEYVDRQLLTKFTIDRSVSPREVLGKMAQADGFVMSNSSLSWWGARLIGARTDDQAPIIHPIPWTSVGSPLDQSLVESTHVLVDRRLLR